MRFSIFTTPTFNKELKRLAKKYPSIKSDLEKLSLKILEDPNTGVNLGQNFYKVRMAITSKGKGKSAGARVITYIKVTDTKIFLASIYDKSDKENISDKELRLLIEQISGEINN